MALMWKPLTSSSVDNVFRSVLSGMICSMCCACLVQAHPQQLGFKQELRHGQPDTPQMFAQAKAWRPFPFSAGDRHSLAEANYRDMGACWKSGALRPRSPSTGCQTSAKSQMPQMSSLFLKGTHPLPRSKGTRDLHGRDGAGAMAAKVAWRGLVRRVQAPNFDCEAAVLAHAELHRTDAEAALVSVLAAF